MSLYEGSILQGSVDAMFSAIKSLMIDNLGFVCESDTGSDVSRVLDFSLSGHYHRCRFWYFNNSTLSISILKLDNTTISTTGNMHSYGNITLYKAVNFNNTRALLIRTNNKWTPVLLFATSGTEKHVMCKSNSAVEYRFAYVHTGNNDIVNATTNGYKIVTTYKTKDGKDLISPMLLPTEYETVICDAPMNDIFFCGTISASVSNKYNIGGNKYLVATLPNVSTIGLLIRYE